ncbi:MAG: MGMT family protein [Candidatus Yanofskybacteria bacterium]|nr:MGMT family protein [Candidatus Yanofskybacteria bacterium]
MTKFQQRVYNIVRHIKCGQAMTYAEVAKAAGHTGAARAVGNALNKNYDLGVPCHRVIRSDGKVGGYNRGSRQKQKILREEGVILADR